MSDYSELERRAQAAIEAIGTLSRARQEREFNDVCTPQVVKALIAENKRLAASVKLNLCDYPAIHQGDVDLLVAFVTGASQIELAKVHNCTPPNISRKICRVKERLGWREGMLVSDIRDRAEQLRALASKGAVVTADLMAERDQLRAEVAGLKTGYEAYERVNAELKAECEALREEIGGLKEVSSVQVKALKALTFAARTTGGTAGPDEVLMKACEEAEGSMSLGGIGRAYMVGADAAMGKGDRP
jgi:cell division protein FtsB